MSEEKRPVTDIKKDERPEGPHTFERADSLLERERSRNTRPPDDSTNHVNMNHGNKKCGHMANGLCGPSEEAVALGLHKAVQPCNGYIVTGCIIREKLAAGITVVQIFEEYRQ